MRTCSRSRSNRRRRWEIAQDEITEDEEDMLDLAVDLDWEMAKTAAALRVFMKGWESYG